MAKTKIKKLSIDEMIQILINRQDKILEALEGLGIKLYRRRPTVWQKKGK